MASFQMRTWLEF